MKRTFSLALIAAAAVAPSATAFAPPSTRIACRNTYCQDIFSRYSSKVFMSDDDDVSNKDVQPAVFFLIHPTMCSLLLFS